MKNIVRKLKEYVLFKIGLRTSRYTKTDQIKALVKMLHPINPGIELVRVGGNNDGGYLVPDDLDGVKHCFSPGVGHTASFELDCLKRGITSFLADGSVNSPPIDLPGCKFLKKFVSAHSDERTITIDDWVNSSLPTNFKDDLILQMDIEGGEFEIILSTPVKTLKRFRIIVVEFHHAEALRLNEFYNIFYMTLMKIRSEFEVVHIHPNNYGELSNIAGILMPRIFEVTFLRKDRIKQRLSITSLPHPLDQPNLIDREDIYLPNDFLNP